MMRYQNPVNIEGANILPNPCEEVSAIKREKEKVAREEKREKETLFIAFFIEASNHTLCRYSGFVVLALILGGFSFPNIGDTLLCVNISKTSVPNMMNLFLTISITR
ncbi:unnamed protein product [Cuscuta epithymum]|uniref:Uncharacterized protein n=1 Tax=Cuscuta epithymum TaxID=186058 RepID=A0AAV0CUF8_9ASTE|nr:unnamed protein product [Cuscuta epithymum]CAH9140466.1 unnamed protein product [Cuscuta epithymum]